VKYPFQANIHGLAPEIIKECILGFVETLHPQHAPAAPDSFKEWVLQTFGKGIARYFMFPYNLKLWRTPLEELSADWVSWSIPKPSLEEFLNGALGIINRDFGYNSTFLYPKTGGIGQLPTAFVSHLPSDRLHYQKTAVAIDVEGQIIRFDDNSTYHYDQLISTIPLKHLVSILHHVPESITRAGKQLRYISVYDVNIGVNRPNISEKHWIYFPEPEYIFYRVGFPSNFSTDVVPAGCSSLYVEVSSLPEQEIAEHILLADIYQGLQECGLLQASDEILVSDVVRIDCAYVIHDRNRVRALESILPYLQQKNIYSTGRYGSWEYSSMENAILSGKQIADTLRR
jgi:protoporphyrinogen oxidase